MTKPLLVLTCCLTLISSNLAMAQAPTASIRSYRSAHEAEILAEFSNLLSIPNVASDTPNIKRNASRIIEMMAKRGIDARLLEGEGPPAIYGMLAVPGASRTIGFYAHYDGQPVEP